METRRRGYQTSVRGRDYVLHIKDGERTLCNRVAADVNCAGLGTQDVEICRVCLARRDRRPKVATRAPTPADKRKAAAQRPVPCLCGSTTYEIVDVGDGLPRTDCCKAY